MSPSSCRCLEMEKGKVHYLPRAKFSPTWCPPTFWLKHQENSNSASGGFQCRSRSVNFLGFAQFQVLGKWMIYQVSAIGLQVPQTTIGAGHEEVSIPTMNSKWKERQLDCVVRAHSLIDSGFMN
jgi:hypothetical protein